MVGEEEPGHGWTGRRAGGGRQFGEAFFLQSDLVKRYLAEDKGVSSGSACSLNSGHGEDHKKPQV